MAKDKTKKTSKEKKPQRATGVKQKSNNTLQAKAERIELKRAQDPNMALSTREYKTLKKYNLQWLADEKKKLTEQKKTSTVFSFRLKKAGKRRDVKLTMPRTVQDTIPYIADYEEGVFEIRPNKYSKLYRLKDINYMTGNMDEQEQIFIKLAEFYNYFGEDMNFAVTVDNRTISIDEQERRVFYPETGGVYDPHVREYNKILRRQIVAGKNDIQTEKYLTVTLDADTAIEAITKFRKIDDDVRTNIRRCGSDADPLSSEERIAYYHDKFRKGHEGELYDLESDTYTIDFDFIKAQGVSTKDYIAPTSFLFKNRYLMIDDGYYKVLYLRELPRTLGDDFFYKLTDNDFPVTSTISVQPLDLAKAIRLVKRQQTSIDMNVIEAEKRAIRAGYNPETIQPSLKQAKRYTDKMVDDVLNNDQKVFFVTITFLVYGKTQDELDENCETLIGKARQNTVALSVLSMQQEDGMKLTIPFGYTSKDLYVDHALTTDSSVVFMPFANQELFQPGGFYYGLNTNSRNLIICNRTKMKSPSGFVLGKSGSGKSFAVKREILNVLLNDTKTNVLIIDPENEYADFCRAFGGTVVNISVNSANFINPFDMPEDYGLDEDDMDDTPLSIKKDKALKKKSEQIMSIVEGMLLQGGNAVAGGDASLISPQQKTIIDRCVRNVYQEYLDHDFDEDYLPTMKEFQEELEKSRYNVEQHRAANGTVTETRTLNENGVAIAEAVAYYSLGSLDVFAHKTNVSFDNRLVVFNVKELGDALRQIALVIVFDFIWSRMTVNKAAGVRTYCYCDEIHVMFQSYYASTFLKQLYKRGRKYGLIVTGITQNVEELLQTEQARGMIGNSDFIMMLAQFKEDLEILAHLLNITLAQMNFVVNADEGCGLLFAENTIVPFTDRFPNTSYLYKLMSTKFGEDMNKAEVAAKIEEILSESKKSEEDRAEDERHEKKEAFARSWGLTQQEPEGKLALTKDGRFLVASGE